MTLALGRCFAEHPTNRLPLLCSFLRFKIHHLVREIDHHLAHPLQQPETEIADDVLEGSFTGVAGRQTVVQESIHLFSIRF